jgi:tRNA threonylcarbamoyl adenosine modification protein (Sua5/YciO/YrdC/YwlC family)
MLVAINTEHPEPRKIAQAAAALRAGEIIAYPTDTTYAFGCDLRNKKAIDRLYEIKRAPKTHQFSFVCPDLSEIAKYAVVENAQYRVLKRHLPGPYTFILEATREVPKLLQNKKKQVGLRVPDHPVIHALAAELGAPILSTTAQMYGSDTPEVDPHEIAEKFPGVFLVLDGGAGGLIGTTIVDLSQIPGTIVREGAGPTDDLV